MSDKNGSPRRQRVERNVYRRPGGRLEIGYRDSSGKQRWKTLPPKTTITAARAARDTILGAKGRGEHVQPNPRLTFSEAAEHWMREQVADLRPQTAAFYENALRHLGPRWGRRRLDAIGVDDAASLVRELRAEGLAERSIQGVLIAASRVFKFACRRLNWHGVNPIPLMETGERPRLSQTPRRRIFTPLELAQTIEAAREPWRSLFSLAAVTGARQGELLGLVWSDLDLRDVDASSLSITYQLDRTGQRQPLKTEASTRTIELPRQMAALLLAHKARSLNTRDSSFVFAARSGRALMQRNVTRALRIAQTKARDERGRPTFPELQETDERGRPLAVPRGTLPSFHAMRHTAASEAIAAGESAEEVSWMLGHRNSIVTRTVYIHEIRNAERQARRRATLEARYGAMLDGVAAAGSASDPLPGAELVDLNAARQPR